MWNMVSISIQYELLSFFLNSTKHSHNSWKQRTHHPITSKKTRDKVKLIKLQTLQKQKQNKRYPEHNTLRWNWITELRRKRREIDRYILTRKQNSHRNQHPNTYRKGKQRKRRFGPIEEQNWNWFLTPLAIPPFLLIMVIQSETYSSYIDKQTSMKKTRTKLLMFLIRKVREFS